MKNLPTYREFLNESSVTHEQMQINGQRIIGKIKVGSKFIGTVIRRGDSPQDATLTVVGFGDRSNAFRVFEVENEEGDRSFLKVTVMYGVNYRLLNTPRGDWDSADTLNLQRVEI